MKDSTGEGRVEPKLLDVAGFAEELGVSYDMALTICASQWAPPMVRIGGQCRPIRAQLDGWLADLAERNVAFQSRRSARRAS